MNLTINAAVTTQRKYHTITVLDKSIFGTNNHLKICQHKKHLSVKVWIQSRKYNKDIPFFSCSSSPTKKNYINSEYDRPNARMRDHSSIASPPSATSTFCFSGMIFADSTSANKNRIMHNFILFNISYSVHWQGTHQSAPW